MKYCTECGKELEKDAKVCGNCGKRIEGRAAEPTVQNTYINNVQPSNVSANQSNGIATAGFVISLISFLACCGTISLLGLIFSIVGLSKSKKLGGNGKGQAIAGIVLGILGILYFILIIILYFLGYMTSIAEDLPSSLGTSL